MRAPKVAREGASDISDIAVWDTHYTAPSKAFNFYRDALCSVYMPWTTTSDAGSDFYGRFETAKIHGGTVSRSRCSEMLCIRNRPELARSDDECFYVLYVLSGIHACEQDGRSNSAGPGEIIVVDSGQPCRVQTVGPRYDVIALTVPKADLRGIDNLEDKLANTVVARIPTSAPLFSCANLIATQLTNSTPTELASRYDACVSLLPLAAGCFDDEHKEKFGTYRDKLLLRALREYADRNVSDPQLSPGKAAENFGISVRYVHKLFASSGTTFNAYVAATRLDNVRRDLLSPSWDRQQISEVAFRWGFNDLSTFNRSFKRRFGTAPTQYRARRSE